MRRLMAPALLAVALLAPMSNAQPPEWTGAQTVSVELSNFKFTPATLTLQHGVVYRLRLSNTSSGGHDFVAKEFFAGASIAPEDRAKIRNGGIDVDGKETVEVRLVAGQPGTYKSHCSHFMHSSFGMTGTIVVR
ncbi:cupredoxin domain-containing protein [Sphingomonas sp. PR090111-T3T-6A]|uniref:cupredoxin domain-containing protein n=1 Tax=Sphingomonas sp. PR090111-T3T-6A TaxID=685778 RepID=UPI000379138C|nr:cupredoxin domain-containing protein [Sphingomonas sp. PR090111-T3T-6A]